MEGTRPESGENHEGFLRQLRTLNKQRAQFLYHKTQMDPDGMEEYLNREPEAFEEFADSFILECALESLVNGDAYMGAHGIARRMEENPALRHRLILELFQKLFAEELYNSEWDLDLADAYKNDGFRASIAKLKALVLFFGNDSSIIEGIKTRFCLALAAEGLTNGMEIPDRLIAMLPAREKKEFGEAIIRNEEQKKEKNTDQNLRIFITMGEIDQSVLLLSDVAKKRVVATLRESLADRFSDAERQAIREEKDKIRLGLVELLEKYPNPGRIIEALLLP